MIELQVNDMTCGSCVNKITDAIKAVDPEANVQADVKRKTVSVEGKADFNQIQNAIQKAGYTAVPPGEGTSVEGASKGCC